MTNKPIDIQRGEWIEVPVSINCQEHGKQTAQVLKSEDGRYVKYMCPTCAYSQPKDKDNERA